MKDIWTVIEDELDFTSTVDADLVEIWDRHQKTAEQASETFELISSRADRFRSVATSANLSTMDDSIHEAVAHIEEVYTRVCLVAANNLRIAQGLVPLRTDGYEDSFIGPTGFIPF